jgi:hypothetical protein
MYLLSSFSKRSIGQKKRRTKEYALNTVAGASVGGAIGSLLAARNPSNIPKNIVRGLVAGSAGGAYKTYRTRKNRRKENNPLKKYINNKLYSNNNLAEFRLLDNLPGRSDKGKKRKGVSGLIQNIKENPVEALAITTGGILAARYGAAGIKTTLRASKKLKSDKYINKAKSLTTEGINKAKNSKVSGQQLNTRETLGKAINISDIPKSKVKQKKVVALASAFLKGSGSKARKDIRTVKKTINYLKTGKK